MACSPSFFGHSNNADRSPFSTTSPFGAQTGGSNSGSTGVFAGTQASSPEGSASVFGASSSPAFGIPSSPAFGTPSTSPFGGAHARKPGFGNLGFGKVYQPPVGSRWCSYAQTPQVDSENPHRAWKLVSISAMSPYKEKTHEELRWEDYLSGDKGSPNPAGQSSDGTEFKTNNMPSNLFSTPFWSLSSNPFATPTSPSPFGTPDTSSNHTLKSAPFWPPTSNPSAPAQSQTSSPSSYPFPSLPSTLGTPDTSNPFGPAQAQTTSVFYTSPSNPFGPPTSHSSFGTPNTSGFGTPSSIPTCGVSVTVAFGAPTTPLLGASSAPAFTASITPAFGSLPTHAYGATSFSFSFSLPVFGQPASAFGSPFGAQSSPFGAHATTPNFGSCISGQPYQQHVGSIQPAGKLESISATRTHDEKSHEELRFKDYRSGVAGCQTSNHYGSAQSQKPSLFRSTSPFFTSSPFGTPNTSNSGTSPSIFGTTQARGTNSVFGNAQSSSLFQSSSAACGCFVQCTSPSFGFSTPIGTKNTSSFGAITFLSPTSVSGSTPGLEATMSPSPFGSELSIGTQSANLFHSSSPDLGQTSSPLAQTGLALEQSTSALISQSDASEGTFSSTPLSTSSMGFNHATSSFTTSSQFAQVTQSPASSHLLETTGGTGSTSNVSTVDQAAS